MSHSYFLILQNLAEVESEKVIAHIESQKNNEKVALADQRMWSLKECTEVLFKCIKDFWQDEGESYKQQIHISRNVLPYNAYILHTHLPRI